MAVDLMGGDAGPEVTLPACLTFAAKYPDVGLLVVGNSFVVNLPELPPNVEFIHTPDQVRMDDKPSTVLRSKQQSSLWKVIDLVSQGQSHACVSAGNTGAMMAIGCYVLKTFPGIDRPAICKFVPTEKGSCLALDLGANVDCSSEQLLQFAFMGNIISRALKGIDKPCVRLLSNGSEDIKGNERIRLASKLLSAHPGIHYAGYIEGHQIFNGETDVVVCDGFVGNIALKISEGAARFLANGLLTEFKSCWRGRLLGFFVRPLLRRWNAKFDPSVYNGASFLGLQGTVVKSHGSVDVRGFVFALESALEQVQHDVPGLIHDGIMSAELTPEF